MTSKRTEPTKQASEEQPAPDDEGGNDQTIVLLDVKPGENVGLKVNKDLAVMQVVKSGPSDGKFSVGDVITHINEKPITTHKQWEDAVAKGGSFQINVNRGLQSVRLHFVFFDKKKYEKVEGL
uniref:PDZ domain-containing protein n=1 Tax=Panagrolaimus sp. ES5 TaxID=591445 RepID=A0AC34F086_9BILA